MAAQHTATRFHDRVRTPRTAAVAGILFAALFSTSIILIRLAVPADQMDAGTWIQQQFGNVTLALYLVPYGGIAFLWFMGVVRDRLGFYEDRFLSTVFLGSGLLFLALTFVSAAMAGGILAAWTARAGQFMQSGAYTMLRAVMFRVSNVYAVRMAGVFMMSLATISVRTGVFPRWLSLLTYALALGLLLSIGSSLWVILIFPAWVGLISLYILATNLRPSAGH